MSSRGWVLVVAFVVAACKGSGSDAPDGRQNLLCGNDAPDPGEVCDDGNTSGGDGCSADCSSDETCGNQRTDATVGEVCDDGNGVDGDGCSADCRSDETCGNHIVDTVTGETCDDGNSVPMDGCSANCQSNEMCGNGVTDAGEACDSMNVATQSCDPDCTAVECGDNVRNQAAGEACDDGDMVNDDGCVGSCDLAVCGDGYTRTSGPAGTLEQCDDGGNGNNDACLDSCAANVCHDGYRNPSTEQCDDGDFDDTDACVDSCANARCGDGHIWTGVETCDDFNTNSGDGCNASCQTEVMQVPMTYVITSPSQLVNQQGECSGTGQNWYDLDPVNLVCGVASWGFTWFDSTPYTPSAVVIELNRGIICGGSAAAGTNINGGFTGAFTLNDIAGTGCNCFPPEEIHGWSLQGIGFYNAGGQNTFLVDPIGNCIGVSYSEALGGYARITVYP